MVALENDWAKLLAPEFEQEYYQQLHAFLLAEYQHHIVYPRSQDIFKALQLTSYEAVRVVIIGQDPYHGEGQAQGLSFSVPQGMRLPPSLRNIYKEISAELGTPIATDGDLTRWAQQGVLLLNSVLTVRAGQANSHKGKGWEQFTDRVIELLNERTQPVVFLLWGANAKQKQALITAPQHLVLTSVHPSPLSAYGGFFGCGHFKRCNEFLLEQGAEPIRW